jgi:hypothetical protein
MGRPSPGSIVSALAAPIAGGQDERRYRHHRDSQPALADLDGDGTIEVIVGGNVLRANGVPTLVGLVAVRTRSTAASVAIGDVDGNAANGLEVVLGRDAWHADGSPLAGRPLQPSLSSACPR